MELEKHYNHEIKISKYIWQDGTPANYSLECFDCFELLESQDTEEGELAK